MRFIHRCIDYNKTLQLAHELTLQLAPFRPQAVVYLEKGGTTPGRAIADELGLPAAGMNIRYPLSRTAERVPYGLRPLLLALKEPLYRITSPKFVAEPDNPLPPSWMRIALVDDTASSGRTLRAALAILETHGIERRSVRTAVLRCGTRALTVVDHFTLTEKVWFARPK